MAEWSAEIWSAPPASGSVDALFAARAAAAFAPKFKMRAKRISNGATVHWIAYRAEDLTGAQSPYPGDIDTSKMVRE